MGVKEVPKENNPLKEEFTLEDLDLDEEIFDGLQSTSEE